MIDCPCDCHGSGAAFRRPCTIDGGCGHTHHDVTDTIACVLCTRRRREIGNCCGVCRDRIDERLADIAVLHKLLPELLIPGAGPQDGGKRGKTAAAPLPCRVDVLNLIGPVNDVHVRYNLDALGDLLCQHGPYATHAVLDALTETAREQLGLEPGPVGQSVPTLVKFLRRQLDRICAIYDPLYQFSQEISEAWSILKSVCGERRPSPIGTCPAVVVREGKSVECGAPLYVPLYSDTIQCHQCGEEWPRERWLLLGSALLQAAV